MAKHGTTSAEVDLGWYITFQADILTQLPRPGEINEEVACGWHENRGNLRGVLREALTPSAKTEEPKPAQEETKKAAVSVPQILFTVTSDGRSFAEIIASIESKGRKVSDRAKDVVRRSSEGLTGEKPTTGVTYSFVGIGGNEFPTDRERTTAKIFAEAKRRKYLKLNVESALLLREKYSQEELEKTGYQYFPVFHEPLCAAGGIPRVLALRRHGAVEWLRAWIADPDDRWDRGRLFLVLAPQVSLP